MTGKKRLLMVETTASLAWFAMDASWMIDARSAALALAVPTVALSLVGLGLMRRAQAVSWLVAGAMASWAVMNVCWMLHDFDLVGWGLGVSKVLLALGAILLGAALVFGRADALEILARRFRRLRPDPKLGSIRRSPNRRHRRGFGVRRIHRIH
jgi:hypothetical protein